MKAPDPFTHYAEFIEGWIARNDGKHEYDNPHDAFREHERFAQWRAGWIERDEEEEEGDWWSDWDDEGEEAD